MNNKKQFLFLGILFICLLISFIIAIMFGAVFIHPLVILKIWIHKLSNGFLLQTNWTNIQELIVINIRTPRIILAMLVGMGLSISGVSMQGLFRNSMADPFVLGMSSGAACGVALSMVLGLDKILGGLSIQSMAFIGAILTIFLVYNIARTNGKIPIETLLLSGIVIGFFLQSIVSFLKLITESHTLKNLILWLMGSFSTACWEDVKLVIFPIFIGIFVIYFFSRELNIFQFGEEQSLHLGIEVETIKKILLITTSFITAICVSVSGIIGFVGLIIPHAMRLVVGPDHKILIPSALISGGIFLILCDTLSRTIAIPEEIPIGIITAIIGAPYFVYLLKRKKQL